MAQHVITTFTEAEIRANVVFQVGGCGVLQERVLRGEGLQGKFSIMVLQVGGCCVDIWHRRQQMGQGLPQRKTLCLLGEGLRGLGHRHMQASMSDLQTDLQSCLPYPRCGSQVCK